MSENPYDVGDRSEERPSHKPPAPVQAKGPSGGSWFYWIAGFSIVNAALLAFGAERSFVVGLGFTQVVNFICIEIAGELDADAGNVVKIIGFAATALAAGVFIVFGVLAGRRQGWAIILGMILYGFDSLLSLLGGGLLSFGFHIFVLFMLYGEFKAARAARALDEMAHSPVSFQTPNE